MLLDALRSAPPGAVALVDGRRSISYAALPALIEREIEWLREGGAERHALLADNGVPWALADLALHVGAMLSVPLPGSFTPAQVAHALDDAGIDALLTDDDVRARELLPGWRADGISPVSGLQRFRRQLDPATRPSAPAGTHKITYTSGSTSNPKGVCLSGRALEAIAESVAGATRDLAIERHLCILPLATLLENVAGLYAPLLRGATCVVPPSSVTGMSYGGLDAARLLGTLSREQPNSLILVPELLQVLVVAAERGWQPPPALQFVAVGGARVSPELLGRADAAGIPVYEGYGLSECASVVCLNTPAARRTGTVGRPLPHVRVRVDASGQVHVAGNTMLGYLGDRRARRTTKSRPATSACSMPMATCSCTDAWAIGSSRALAATCRRNGSSARSRSASAAGRCWSTASHAHTSSRWSVRPRTRLPTLPSTPPSLRRMRRCRTTRRCVAGRAPPVLSRPPTAR